jgi:hypothetical protein
MRWVGRTSWLIGLLALILAGCQSDGTPSPTPAPQPVGVTPLYLDWTSQSLSDYREENTDARFNLDIYPINVGLQALEAGDIDLLIGAIEGQDPHFTTPLFQDGIAVIHHPDLEITDLTIEELRSVFAGAEQNWNVFGADDLRIYPVIPLPGDDLRSLFKQRVMGNFQFSSLARLESSPVQIIDLVEQEPGAIGVVPFSQLTEDTAILNVEGQTISLRSINNGRYPLTFWVVAVGMHEPGGALRSWLAWVQAQDS